MFSGFSISSTTITEVIDWSADIRNTVHISKGLYCMKTNSHPLDFHKTVFPVFYYCNLFLIIMSFEPAFLTFLIHSYWPEAVKVNNAPLKLKSKSIKFNSHFSIFKLAAKVVVNKAGRSEEKYQCVHFYKVNYFVLHKRKSHGFNMFILGELFL